MILQSGAVYMLFFINIICYFTKMLVIYLLKNTHQFINNLRHLDLMNKQLSLYFQCNFLGIAIDHVTFADL